MVSFVAQVKDKSGKILREKVEANNIQQAKSILRQRYAAVGKISQASGGGFKIDLSNLETMLSNITIKDKAIFSRQFSVLVNAGVAIVRSLGVLSEQTTNPKLKKALEAISADVQEGKNLSEALRKHPDCFDNLYVSMVEAGEVGGVLDEVLNRLSKLLEDMARLKNQIKSAMAYPSAVGIFAVLVFVGMTVFLIPIFAGIFQDLGAELPALTQFMLNLSNIMRSPQILIPIGIFIVVSFLLRQYYKTPVGRYQIDKFFLTMPLFGDLNEKSAVARFCRVFGTLTRSGVPILNCLDIVGDTIGNKVLSDAVANAKKDILEGGQLSIAIEKEKIFPAMAVQMMKIGEETGELDAMMMKVADFYEDEVEQAVKALTSLIEPIMMVGIAVIVGVILLSMYLPMFSVFDQIV